MKTFPHRQSACRSLQLAPILVAAVLVALCPIQTRASTIVFNTFGPNNSYSSGGSTVGFGGSLIEAACQFTAQAGGNLATVDLGLAFVPGTPNALNVFLYGDAAGSPNNADQTLLGSVSPMAFPTITSLTVLGTVPVTMGSVYWLVLKPVNVDAHVVWGGSSPAVTGTTDFSRDDVTWQFTKDTLNAFRITAQGAIATPDSGATVMLLGTALGMLSVAWRFLPRRG